MCIACFILLVIAPEDNNSIWSDSLRRSAVPPSGPRRRSGRRLGVNDVIVEGRLPTE